MGAEYGVEGDLCTVMRGWYGMRLGVGKREKRKEEGGE